MIHLDTNTWEYGPVDKGINRMHHSIDISVVDYADTKMLPSYELLS